MVERKKATFWRITLCVLVETFNNGSSTANLFGNDEEMGSDSRAEKVGPYQFVWTEGEDYYDGIFDGDADKTDVPSLNKVGRGFKENDDERVPLISKDS